MVRAASASDSTNHSALNTKFKRGRFLQRQQCQEGEGQSGDSQEETVSVTKSEPPSSPPPAPGTALVKPHSSPIHNSPPPKEEPADHPPLPPDRQPSLDPL